ncbi:MAG: AMP-binding protein [Deltaproteobacteria bacterium]|nr:AMP-binding protein [Deltaproteobacteria bacterium]MBT6434231.1 AMP-binding protein [Deltaproteobacteria bacterium]
MSMIPHPLQSAALSRPQHLALADQDLSLSYSQLLHEVQSLASSLRAQGVTAGDAVALVGDYDVRWVVGLHAIGWLGAIAVPLAVDLPQDQSLDLAKACGVKFWLCGDLKSVHEDTIRLSERAEPILEETYWGLEDVRLMLATSGSTGQPRIVSMTTSQLLFSAMGSMIRLGHELSDRWLCALPLNHVGGLSMVMRALWAAVSLEFALPFDPKQFSERIHSNEVSLCSLVPEMLRRVLKVSGGAQPPKNLRAILIGGDACPSNILEEAKAADYPVSLTWGMTESASQVATRFPGDFSEHTGSGPSLTFARVKEDNGELVIEGPVVAGSKLATTDRGFIDERGCVHVLGRADDIMISGGENIAPRRIEEALLKLGLVESAAVVDVPHSRWGSRPVAFITTHEHDAALISDGALREGLKEHLSGFEIPDVFYLGECLPQAGIGKVDRKTLRSVAGSLGLGRELEVTNGLKQIFGNLARLEGGKVDDDMNELSGTSQITLGAQDSVIEGDGGSTDLGHRDFDGQALTEPHGPLVVGVGMHERHAPFPVIKNVGDAVTHSHQELLEDRMAVLVDPAEKGDPSAVDLVETNSDDMLKSHGCSGNQSEGSCDESL